MEFLFFEGPINVRQLYPEMVENSYLTYSEIVEENFVVLDGQRIRVEYFQYSGWNPLEIQYDDPRIGEIRTRTSLNPSSLLFLPVRTEEVEKQTVWRPVEELFEEDQWLSLMVDDGIIVGFYFGEVFSDDLGRKYSTHSYLNIRPDYRGKGLCRPFAQFTYDNVVQSLQVVYLYISVAAREKAGACRCYVRAAQNLGFRVYGEVGKEYAYYKEIGTEDCNSGNLLFLVFISDGREFDEEMEISINK